MTTRATPNGLLSQLRQFAVFEHFDNDDLENVMRAIRVRPYKRREAIFLSCDEPNNVYFLIEGSVKIARIDPQSCKQVILLIVRPGELFGLQTRDVNTSAFALQPSRVGSMRRADFDRLTSSHEFSLRLNHLVGDQLSRVATRLDELVFRDVPTRLSRLLLRLADEFPVEIQGSRAIDIALTQQDLAELIGTTRESANIALNDLKRRGLVEVCQRLIVIKDPERLAEGLS